MTNKIRVAVLFGGNSYEKEISLESGRNVIYKLSPTKYEVIPLFVSQALELYQINHQLLTHHATKGIEEQKDPTTRINWSDLPSIADFVFIALHGGVGENGSVQGALELLGLPYNGSSIFASALCIDKFKTNSFLASKGFDVPAHLLIDKHSWCNDQEATIAKILTLPLPLIAKPHDDGCSALVFKVTTVPELVAAVSAILAQKEYALIEECITGMELTVGVIGNQTPQALVPSQALATRGVLSIEEKFLPGAGENQTPAPLSNGTLLFIQQTIERVYAQTYCIGYARIDCFYQDKNQSPTGTERLVILEINTLPGLTPATVIFHQAAELDISPATLLDTIIELGFKAHATNQAKRPHDNVVNSANNTQENAPAL